MNSIEHDFIIHAKKITSVAIAAITKHCFSCNRYRCCATEGTLSVLTLFPFDPYSKCRCLRCVNVIKTVIVLVQLFQLKFNLRSKRFVSISIWTRQWLVSSMRFTVFHVNVAIINWGPVVTGVGNCCKKWIF